MPEQHDTTRSDGSERSTTSGVLPPGTPAPDFTLQAGPGQPVTLSALKGKPVVLAFYPADWSPVCGDELALFNEIHSEFREQNAELLGISVDSVWCHKAYAETRKLHFPLLADFEPKGAVSRRFGAYRDSDGFSERALFVLDANGVIRWSYLSPVGVNPGADGILDALESLSPAADDASAPARMSSAQASSRSSSSSSAEARP
jgi:peroxiredoxin